MHNMEIYQKLALCEFYIKDGRYVELFNSLRLIDALKELYDSKRVNK